MSSRNDRGLVGVLGVLSTAACTIQLQIVMWHDAWPRTRQAQASVASARRTISHLESSSRPTAARESGCVHQQGDGQRSTHHPLESSSRATSGQQLDYRTGRDPLQGGNRLGNRERAPAQFARSPDPGGAGRAGKGWESGRLQRAAVRRRPSSSSCWSWPGPASPRRSAGSPACSCRPCATTSWIEPGGRAARHGERRRLPRGHGGDRHDLATDHARVADPRRTVPVDQRAPVGVDRRLRARQRGADPDGPRWRGDLDPVAASCLVGTAAAPAGAGRRPHRDGHRDRHRARRPAAPDRDAPRSGRRSLARTLDLIKHGRLVVDTTVAELLQRASSGIVRCSPPRRRGDDRARQRRRRVTSTRRDTIEVDGLAPEHVAGLLVGARLRFDGLTTGARRSSRCTWISPR